MSKKIKTVKKADFTQKKVKVNAAAKKNKRGLVSKLFALVLVGVLLFGVWWVYAAVRDFNFAEFRAGLFTSLETTDGKTQVLLLGRGGGNHEGPDLTDTIIVASVDHVGKRVTLLSIPRDLLVNVRGVGETKINQLYLIGKDKYPKKPFTLVRQAVGEIVDFPIHHVVLVDFDGFVRTVDALGGVDVDVKRGFVDVKYPAANFQWQTVRFAKGKQVLNGRRALQFARSRHSLGEEGSDFARSQRQQKVIRAVVEKLRGMGYFTDLGRLRDLYEAFRASVVTDLTFKDILSVAKLAYEIPRERIQTHALTDGFFGLLYAPDPGTRWRYYGGMFFLAPLGNNYDKIHKFTQLIFDQPGLLAENVKIEVLNGTGEEGKARDCQYALQRFGFKNIVRTANTENGRKYEKTEIYDRTLAEYPKSLVWLKDFVGGVEVATTYETMPSVADLTIILGVDEECSVQ